MAKVKAKVKWPDNDIMSKCCDVYSIFNDRQNSFTDRQNEDWMLSYEFLGNEKNVVIVEEYEPLIEYDKNKRLYIGFNGVHFTDDDLASITSLVNTILLNYKDETCCGFQKQATASLGLILTKLHEFEAAEDSEYFSYDVIFCGYSIGGSIAATAFTNLITRLRLKANSIQIPKNSIMSFSVDNKIEIQQNCQNLTDKKIRFESGHTFRCITHGALMFGNQENKEYCNQSRISKGIFNVIHEKDPLPKIFHQLTSEFREIKADNAIGNFRILQNKNNKIYVTDINNKENNEIEEFLITNEILPFELMYHNLDEYKLPVNQGNTELDVIERINKDFEKIGKPYICTDIIGKGSFGVVVKATNFIDNTTVAIKKVNSCEEDIKFEAVDNEENIIDKNLEIKNLLKLKNENIVSLVDYFDFQKQKIYLVFEYCSYGSLESYIISDAKVYRFWNEHALRQLSSQLLDGLSAIHGKKIIHRDIKPANILVTFLQNGSLCYKISDLGSSMEYQGRSKLLTAVGTQLYMSPEIYLAYKNNQIKLKINPKTDVFSLGAVILFCIVQKNPWSDHEFNNLIKHGFQELVTVSRLELEVLKNMLASMLKVKSHERLSAESLLLHPFIKDDRVKLHNKDNKEIEEKIPDPVTLGEFKKKENMWENNEVEKDIATDFIQVLALKQKALDSCNTGYFTDSISSCNEALKIATSLKKNDGVEICMESVKMFLGCDEMELLPSVTYGNEAIDSDISSIYRILGQCHHRMEDFKTSINDYQKSIEIDRTLEKTSRNFLFISNALHGLGECYTAISNYKEAIKCLNESLVTVAVAFNIQNTKEFKEIITLAQLEHVELTLCSVEDDGLISDWCVHMVQIINGLSACYISAGKTEKSLSHMKAALALMSSHAEKFEDTTFASIHANMGAVYLKTNDKKKDSLFHLLKAYEIVREVTKDDLVEFPESPTLVSNLGLYYAEVEKDFLKAIEYTHKSLALNKVIKKNTPDSSMKILGDHNNLAILYWQLGNVESAIFHFEQVVNTSSDKLMIGEYKERVQDAFRALGKLYEPIEPSISKFYYDKYYNY